MKYVFKIINSTLNSIMTIYQIDRFRWDFMPLSKFADYNFGWVKDPSTPVMCSSLNRAEEYIEDVYKLNDYKSKWDESGNMTEPCYYAFGNEKYMIIITKKEID